MSESDVAMVRRLLSSASSGEDRSRLASLVSRLESSDEQLRSAAQRELHAMRALGISGVAHSRGHSLKDSGRTSSDSRIGRSYMPPSSSPSVGGNNNNNSSSNSNNNNNIHSSASAVRLSGAAAVAAASAEDEKPKRRLSFWQRRKGSTAVPIARGMGGLPSEMDESWDVPCDALGAFDWVWMNKSQAKKKKYECFESQKKKKKKKKKKKNDAFVSTDGHGLLEVKTKKFSIGLGGALCSSLPDALVLEDWESYRFLYEEVFVGRPHSLYLGRGPKGPVIVAVESMGPTERKGDRNRFRVLALDKVFFFSGRKESCFVFKVVSIRMVITNLSLSPHQIVAKD